NQRPFRILDRRRRRPTDGSPRDPDPRDDASHDELPEPPREGRLYDEAAGERALVRKPQIGDSRPAPRIGDSRPATARGGDDDERESEDDRGERDEGGRDGGRRRRGRRGGRNRRRGGRGRGRRESGDRDDDRGRGDDRGGRGGSRDAEIEAELLERRRGKERDGRPVGRYLMCVHKTGDVTQVAVLEGRSLVEHYVSRDRDDVDQILGNIYLGRVQNVLPGMEAAFIDIGTPKNAVLYRGDVQFDKEDVVEQGPAPRIEHVLHSRQLIMCQVTKNPIGAKGARLTQEVSIPGRFVVLVPDSKTYGISKRLPDEDRRRLRSILERIKPAEHGVIVRTAAVNATEHELRTDMTRLLAQWEEIKERSRRANGPSLLYREPSIAMRVIREEFNSDYRGIAVDDRELHAEIAQYIGDFNPEFRDRVEYHDPSERGLALFEEHRVHEQVRKALDRKVWLPSGGSIVIEHTEALTVIDVNTGKNVGRSSLEETVFANNMEAADEIARQLRLRDIGGIIVIDFIDMEVKDHRRRVIDRFRDALSRDKTRTQVFEISELGLVEMTRKRIGEGLLASFADTCRTCEGRGISLDLAMLD
ncbi:MAG: Rne/Rng family ribonuclease, partial [Ilumatobacteraceae bacterium]